MDDHYLSAEEDEWLDNVSKLPRTRVLFEHLASTHAVILSGGIRGIEAPIEQAATWRRIFCYDYTNCNSPLGINCSGVKLPRCVGILNLSGKHCIYHSSHDTLAKVVCLSGQANIERMLLGVTAVLEAATKTNASILFTFCLPFQAGLERIYWDVRTIRKVEETGEVIDGELYFSVSDTEPRTVPSTTSVEHWEKAAMDDLVRKMRSAAAPICVDRASADVADSLMSRDAMQTMIEMLKSDRANVIKSHKTEIDNLVQKHSVELTNAIGRAEEAEEDASIRIAKVAHKSKTTEDTYKAKIEHLEKQNASLSEQLAIQKNATKEAKASLEGEKLERQQEHNQSTARQKMLEAQIAKLKLDIAKQTGEQAKTRARLQETVATLQNKVQSQAAASLAVEASAKEARSYTAMYQSDMLALTKKLEQSKVRDRVVRGLLALAALRTIQIRDRAEFQLDVVKESKNAEADAPISTMEDMTAQVQCASMSSQTDAIQDDHESAMAEARREIDRKEHLIREMSKRIKSLESMLNESNEELQKVTSSGSYESLASAKQKDANSVRDRAKKDNVVTQPIDEKSKAYAHNNTVNFNQNTAVFMSHTPHQQPYGTRHPFFTDPSLEHTISSLHSALNHVVSTARAASYYYKQAEQTQIKLDVLASMAPSMQAMYYDPTQCGFPDAGSHPH